MINRKYLPNKKNGGKPPKLTDERVKYVPIGCQICMECRKQKARAWQARLSEEIRHDNSGKFITLTFNQESIEELTNYIAEKNDGEIPGDDYELNNQIASTAVRLFLERWRKKHKKSIKHWLITELGHNGTERIHLHGIIWTNDTKEIEKHWQYGYVWTGKGDKKENYVSERTINYIIKYVTKIDEKHKKYTSKILTSKGIGSSYTKRHDFTRNQFNEHGETKETYILRTGAKINLPIYYRNKRYSEKEREKLWIKKIEKGERWICGIRLIKPTPEQVSDLLISMQNRNKQLGYPTINDWTNTEYENELRHINRLQNISIMRHGKKQLLQNTRT